MIPTVIALGGARVPRARQLRSLVWVPVLAICVAPGSVAHGQTSPGNPASADTAGSFLGLKPSYHTQYNVARQTQQWQQKLEFGAVLALPSCSNGTDFTISHDSNRDEDRRNGTNATRISWLFLKGIPLSTNLNIGRISRSQPGTEEANGTTNVSLEGVLRRNLLAWRHTLNLRGGWDTATRRSTLQDASSKATDSGLSGKLDWKGNWAPGNFNFDAGFTESRTGKTSRVEDVNGVTERPTSNTNRMVKGTAEYKPFKWLTTDAGYDNTSGEDEYFQVQAGASHGLEQKINAVRQLSLGMLLTPKRGTEWDFGYTARTKRLNFRLRSDQGSSGEGEEFRTKLKTRLWATDIEGSLTTSSDILRPQTSPHFDTQDSNLELKFIRQLNKKLSLNLSGWIRVTSTFYLTGEPEDQLDRDERKVRVAPSLRYLPNNRWTVTLTYTQLNTRRVELNPIRASQTSSEEDYTVDVSLTYRVNTITTINQVYSIKANYKTFDFFQQNNRLTSTQRITTGFATKVRPNVDLRLDHRFTLIDAGPFSIETGGARLFARTTRAYTQELTADLQYKPRAWLTWRANSRLYRKDDVNEATDVSITRRIVDLTLGGTLNRELPGGVRFSANADYVQSTSRDSYWQLTSSLDKVF